MIIKAQTTFADLLKELHELQERGKFFSPDSAAAVSLSDRIAKLREASDQQALLLRGLWHMQCGDAAAAVRKLTEIKDSELNPGFHRFCVLVNLGFATEALTLFKIVGSPTTGQFTVSVPGGLAAGAIGTIAGFINQAKSMHLSNLDGIAADKLLLAGSILESYGTKDEEIARVLDVSGAVIREHGLLHLGHVDVDASETSGKVTLRYRLAVDPDQAIWLYDQFLDRLYDEEVPVPNGLIVVYDADEPAPFAGAVYKDSKSQETRV
ncbi:hypothetical protein [Paraburkholderia sp. UCT2]|uniref:hypothetical protein n=1 Tax=Paraburkholderia sp. UCT2 TaxID=2615208 RepID=UPI0016561348|nr:hypothetical protein [Paraburkholderia sp. UCT2]MBC8730032.1 hypothetical protein [Paraburkholderia sp. UCT2]